MIISPSILLPLISRDGIIENLTHRELTNPEGAGFDLTVASINKIKGAGSLLIDTRKTSDIELIAEQLKPNSIEEQAIKMLEGGSTYLLTTLERFKLANDMLAMFHPRSTLFRSGVIFQSGVAPFGYEGPMTFMIYIANPAGFEIQIGARFAHVNIMSVKGKSSAYRGQWQNGRISANKEEKQK